MANVCNRKILQSNWDIHIDVEALDREDKFKPAFVSDGGTRYYSDEQLNKILGKTMTTGQSKVTIGYCRVSSPKQKDDLRRQEEDVRTYMLANGYQFEIVTDIGSGINYNNKGLNELLDRITDNQVDKIVILHKDRLVRFGFELIENLCRKYGTMIEIIDHTEKTEEQELVEDLVQIVTVFSGSLQGKRANKARKIIQELIQDDAD